MAPVALDPNPSYIPLALAVSHAVAVASLSYIIGLGLYRSRNELGPAQDTRHRSSQRLKLTSAFGALAAFGLSLAIDSGISYLKLSYNVWADERGVNVPNSYLAAFGGLTRGPQDTNGTSLHLTQWLNDTPVYLDALEIVSEKARRLWWGQQLDLATMSWTMLLAIEGRRRQIPFLWAYASLAHLVSLSFAQNLFHVAMLLTPARIPLQTSRLARLFNKAFPPKPTNWFPRPAVLLVPLLLSYATIFLLPHTTGAPWFKSVVILNKLLAFAPLILPTIIPESAGKIHSEPHDTYGSISKIFQLMSLASTVLHAKTTAINLFSNLPDAYKHRHSIKIPFDTEKRSAWERSASSAEKVLGVMTDHPAVAAVGKDALLCAFSLGLWAAVRAMEVGDILQSAVPFYRATPEPEATTEAQPRVHEEPLAPELSMTLRRRGRPAKASTGSSDGLHDDSTQVTPRRRGRPRKVKSEIAADPEEVPGDETYEPTPMEKAAIIEGDVVPKDEFDWESSALAWGATALGGLGLGTAAVYGAECISR